MVKVSIPANMGEKNILIYFLFFCGTLFLVLSFFFSYFLSAYATGGHRYSLKIQIIPKGPIPFPDVLKRGGGYWLPGLTSF